MRALVLLILVGVILGGPGDGGVPGPTRNPEHVVPRLDPLEIRCSFEGPGSLDTRSGYISCRVRNRSSAAIVLGGSSPVLEGPIGMKGYVNTSAAGERFENVLEYGVSRGCGLDRPADFEPSVNLDDEDFARMWMLGPGESGSVRVTVGTEVVAAPELAEAACVQGRLKLIYVPETELNNLAAGATLPARCQAVVKEGLIAARGRTNGIAMEAKRTQRGRPFLDDGCHDVVSSLFRHAYSNTVVVSSKCDGRPALGE